MFDLTQLGTTFTVFDIVSSKKIEVQVILFSEIKQALKLPKFTNYQSYQKLHNQLICDITPSAKSISEVSWHIVDNEEEYDIGEAVLLARQEDNTLVIVEELEQD